jgi:hypothetical protein
MQLAVERLEDQMGKLDHMFGATADERAVATTRRWSTEPQVESLPDATARIVAAALGR